MRRKGVLFGLILIIIGVLLLGRSYGLFFFTFRELMRFVVPLALILAGIGLIVRRRKQDENLKAHIHLATAVSGSATSARPQSGVEPETGTARFSPHVGQWTASPGVTPSAMRAPPPRPARPCSRRCARVQK